MKIIADILVNIIGDKFVLHEGRALATININILKKIISYPLLIKIFFIIFFF
jgi:hypothetical protein